MNEELYASHKTATWDLVRTLLVCRWVYKIKTDVDGSSLEAEYCVIATTTLN